MTLLHLRHLSHPFKLHLRGKPSLFHHQNETSSCLLPSRQTSFTDLLDRSTITEFSFTFFLESTKDTSIFPVELFSLFSAPFLFVRKERQKFSLGTSFLSSTDLGQRICVISQRSQTSSASTPLSSSLPPPEPKQFAVGVWLLVCAGMVAAMILLGGVTRLTESGLSITEWKPFRGALPPLSQEDWEVEFSKYKDSPEYQKLNAGMSLQEFKFIYYMEWAHRQWGRAIGLAFFLPMLYFTAKLLAQCVGLFALGGAQVFPFFFFSVQGAMGWYMVSSGLSHETFEKENSQPRVSAYRLTAHLILALTAFTGLLTVGMVNFSEVRELNERVALAGTTIFSGGFVAGLDAGLIYNTFPLMGEQWIPEGLTRLSPLWKNFFENDTTVQFDHRLLGMTTYAVVMTTWGVGMLHRRQLNPTARKFLHLVAGAANLQVALGITTLLTFVPVPVAAAHQSGAVLLWTSLLLFRFFLKRGPK